MGAEENLLAVHFGKNLRRCREAAGISQEALGFLTSLHRTEIGLLERGAREPQLSTILKLAGALEVPSRELFAGIGWRLDGAEFKLTGPGDVSVE